MQNTFKKKLKNFFMSEIKEEVKQRVFSYQLPGLNQYNHYFNTEFLEEKRNEIILYALDNNNKKIKNSTYLVIKGLIPLNNSIFYSLNLIST